MRSRNIKDSSAIPPRHMSPRRYVSEIGRSEAKVEESTIQLGCMLNVNAAPYEVSCHMCDVARVLIHELRYIIIYTITVSIIAVRYSRVHCGVYKALLI